MSHFYTTCYIFSNRSGIVPLGSLQLERLSRQPLVSFQVLCLRFCDDLARQHWPGRFLVPIERLEIIADKLLVETRLAFARFVFIGGPKARRIGSQQLIN